MQFLADNSSNTPVLDIQSIVLLVGALVPLLVAAITKKYSSPIVKSATNIVLVVVGAVVTLLIQKNGSVTWQECVNAIIQAFIASVAAYKGLWKPLNVGNIAPKTGIGREVTIAEQPGSYQVSNLTGNSAAKRTDY